MFKRLFLAATIAIPLYLTIAIQQTSSRSDEVNQNSRQVIKNIEQTGKIWRQELKGRDSAGL
jgi:ABC-type transporter MlaC component